MNAEQSEPKPSFKNLNGIDGESRLTRYMSLPTFLLLLAGKVFIPTLAKLRETDRLESNVPKNALSDYWKHVEEMLSPAEDWLIEQALASGRNVAVRGSKTHLIESWFERRFGVKPGIASPTDQPHNSQTMATLIEVWLDELAKRRCIWCWNNEPEGSHAMWRLYGDKGISVISTVNRIFASLSLPARVSCSISNVVYVPNPLGGEKRNAYELAYQKLIGPTYLPRPYYFKEIGYQYEHEARFAFAVDALVLGFSSAPGVVLQIDPNKLIENVDDVQISPHILKGEQQVIKKLIERSLGKNPSIDLSLDASLPGEKFFIDAPIHPFDHEGFGMDASPEACRQLLSPV